MGEVVDRLSTLTVTVVADELPLKKCPQNLKRRGNIAVEPKLTIFGAADERLYCFAVDIAGQRRARWERQSASTGRFSLSLSSVTAVAFSPVSESRELALRRRWWEERNSLLDIDSSAQVSVSRCSSAGHS